MNSNAMNDFVTNLMGRMTLEEKIGQLNLAAPGVGSTDEVDLVTGTITTSDSVGKVEKGLVGGFLNVRGPNDVRRYQELALKSRLGIPLIFGLDVIHGHVTGFPIPLALSATWNMNLIESTARAAAKEAVADGIKWLYSPMVDVSRDPRWGRVAEGSGEDVYLNCLVAEAMVKGYQGDDLSARDSVMACLKHFAGYGFSESGRDYNTVDMSEQRLREIVLPPFKAGIDAGAGSIMTAFNDVNGIPATMNKWLMANVARIAWGFDGFFVSDYASVNETTEHGIGDLKHVSTLALKAGLDMDMVGEGFLTTLKQSLKDGSISMDHIDRACRNVLEAKYKLNLFEDPYYGMDEDNVSKIHLAPKTRALAREAVVESCVLLKNNENALPLKKSGKIALIGPLANDQHNVTGMWGWSVKNETNVTVKQGLENALDDAAEVLYAPGANITDDPIEADNLNVIDPKSVKINPDSKGMIAEAVKIAKQSDVIVAVVGEAKDHTGECASRTDIGIPKSQRPLLEALSATAKETGKPLVLVVMGGRPLTLEWENENADAMLMAWHGGTETGSGLADILLGDKNFSGRLTMSFPRNVGQIPIYYGQPRTGRPLTREDSECFEKFKTCYLDSPNSPLFPFGYGLSYTTFDYSPVSVSKTELKGNQKLQASVTITNTGERAGEEVVQLYIRDIECSRTRPSKELKGFEKVLLQPSETRKITFDITTKELEFLIDGQKFGWEAGEFAIHIGRHAEDTQQATVLWNKPDPRPKNNKPTQHIN